MVDALAGPNLPDGPYSEDIHKTAMKVVYAYRAGQEVQNCCITDLEEYKAEVERRRDIGRTIDPAIAETNSWYEDMSDRYDILDEKYHEGCVSREYFARNPGGTWVNLGDLPEGTGKVFFPKHFVNRIPRCSTLWSATFAPTKT